MTPFESPLPPEPTRLPEPPPPPELAPPPALPAETPLAAPELPPDHAAEVDERLDPRIVPYGIIVNLIGAAILITLLTVGFTWWRTKEPALEGWLRLAWIGSIALLGISALVQPVLLYWTWRWFVDGQLLVARHGILFREEKVIPVSRLQHVDLRRGPIERLFSLATLVVYTAGTEGATFRVPGLAADRARQLRDRILAARGQDVV